MKLNTVVRSLPLLLGALIAGCNNKPAGNSPTVKGDGKSLEVAIFQGGYGVDFFEESAREYEKSHPGVKINLWGNPRVWEQLRPRFVSGSPPDLTWPGWDLDTWSLIMEDQVLPLDEALDSPAFDGKGTWRDTFEPSTLSFGKFKGKQYMMPYHFSIWGWWYDAALFEKHGWKAPTTYKELLALCEQIKAAGIAPLTYQGKYPTYLLQGALLPWAVNIGGKQVIDNAQSLVPGAWKDPAILQAAKMIEEIRVKGYIQEGAAALSHTEAQMEFLNGRAAMIPCGTWLYSEEQKVMPAGVKLTYFNTPFVEGGQGDPSTVSIVFEPWIVPLKGTNRDLAIDFYKFLTSKEKATQFVERKATLMSIKGANDAKLPESLVGAAKAFREAKVTWTSLFGDRYHAFGKEVENAMGALATGKATPEEFCERCEAAAKKTREAKDFVPLKFE